jgi:hypothetical protein
MMSSASGDDWSDNDFEEADEPDVGDMLTTLTEVGFVRARHRCRSRYVVCGE